MAVISSAVRNNLLALTNTTAQQGISQNRLATGKKVNSALDNPTNFFTASSLSNRASGLSSLLDGMSNGIKTLEAADNGITAIKKNIESMQANIRSARADKSFKGESRSLSTTASGTLNLRFSGGSVGDAPVTVGVSAGTAGKWTSTANFAAVTFTDDVDSLNFSIAVDGGSATAYSITGADVKTVGDADGAIDSAAEFQSLLEMKGITGVTASEEGSKLVLTSKTVGTSSSVTLSAIGETDADNDTTDPTPLLTGAGTAGAATGGKLKTVDEIVTAVNGTTALQGKIRASNDGGKLRIENLSTKDLSVVGMSSTELNGGVGNSNTTTIGGNEVRKNLISQFNDLRTQVDKLAGDASFNGINLLRSDKLKITFNDDGTNNLEIQAKSVAGTVRGIDTSDTSLAIGEATDAEFSDDSKLDARLDALSKAVTTLSTQSSTFGSALTTIQTRQDFTKSMINTLQAGADSLVNADLNEESATLLALNTRQQLSQTALSLASQADQAVLRLF